MIRNNNNQKAADLKNKLQKFWERSAEKIALIEKNYDNSKGSPVFTVNGNYTTRGWTEWTQGFQYGSLFYSMMQQDEKSFLKRPGRKQLKKWRRMSAIQVCMIMALIM